MFKSQEWFIAEYNCVARWLIGRFVAFRPKGRGFESRSSLHVHVGTLDKFFTGRCLWRFGVKLRHSSAVSGASLTSSGLEEALQK